MSEKSKALASHLPWRRMKDMRNRLAHSYAGVRVDVVWDTASVRVPELETFLRSTFGPDT